MEMNKRDFRIHVRSILCRMQHEERARKSGLIATNLYSIPGWKEARSVFIFLSMPDEVNTQTIIDHAIEQGKLVAVPRVTEDEILFHDCFRTRRFLDSKIGIREPSPDEPVLKPEEIDMPLLVVTPGLAFDREKQRLGRGRGYYDRFLAYLRSNPRIRFISAAVCYSEQLFDSIPVYEHDEKVDCIVTDRELVL
jgi:5-formyltetrahydrofolate cyclo-ligase